MARKQATHLGRFDTPTIGVVIGWNVKQIREGRGVTQREFAAWLRANGVPWSHAQLASIESGRRADIELSTTLLLCSVLGVSFDELLAGGSPDLRASEGVIALSGEYAIVGAVDARAILDHVGDTRLSVLEEHGVDPFWDPAPMDADERIAQRLGVPLHSVVDAARDLWGGTLTEERNKRVAGEADEAEEVRRTRRGHITRQLGSELASHMGLSE